MGSSFAVMGVISLFVLANARLAYCNQQRNLDIRNDFYNVTSPYGTICLLASFNLSVSTDDLTTTEAPVTGDLSYNLSSCENHSAPVLVLTHLYSNWTLKMFFSAAGEKAFLTALDLTLTDTSVLSTVAGTEQRWILTNMTEWMAGHGRSYQCAREERWHLNPANGSVNHTVRILFDNVRVQVLPINGSFGDAEGCVGLNGGEVTNKVSMLVGCILAACGIFVIIMFFVGLRRKKP